MRLREARIGYAPYSPSLAVPGDRRRFCFYANARRLAFDVMRDPSLRPDLAVVTSTADITKWAQADRSTTIVYDLVDSYLALPRRSPKSLGRGVAKRLSGETTRLAWDYRKAIARMCSRADGIVCSTEEQRQMILSYCDNVHVILDHHGPEAKRRKENFHAHRPFRLVWEGLPYTLPAFRELAPALQRLTERHAVELHLVSDLQFRRYAGRFGHGSTHELASRYVTNPRLHEWRIDTLADVVASCDLAVIPALLDDPMFAGKPENKLLLFWRMAMPVVTSATPAYQRAMAAAGLDMTCTDAGSWERRLERYVVDRKGREDAAQRGHRYVEAQHSERRLIEQWDGLFASVGFDAGR